MFTHFPLKSASPDCWILRFGWGVCWFLAALPALGQGPGGGRTRPSDYYQGAPPAAPTVLTPHGGQYLAAEAYFFELVVMPLQTRIYVFDKSLNPITSQGIRVQMAMRLDGEKMERVLAFKYVIIPPNIGGQDYLAAEFDMALLHGKETPMKLEFLNVPDKKQPTTSFSPLLSRSVVRPYVARVLASEKWDKDAVLRQRTCPVDRESLGVHRPVVKVLIGDFPLYLCSEECLDLVRDEPEKYLPQQQPPARP